MSTMAKLPAAFNLEGPKKAACRRGRPEGVKGAWRGRDLAGTTPAGLLGRREAADPAGNREISGREAAAPDAPKRAFPAEGMISRGGHDGDEGPAQ